ncbi:MAG: hypothetical protein KDA87_02410 [Planctomycetales bacterium]|nr:hypothetical protein [Planctomycetales bacterium]
MQEEPAQVIYLPDGKGGFVPVFNLPYPKLREYIEREQAIAASNQPQPIRIQSVAIDAEVKTTYVESELQFELSTNVPQRATGEPQTDTDDEANQTPVELNRNSTWHKVTLGFPNAAPLESKLTCDAEDVEFELTFENDKGFVAWFRGDLPGTIQLTGRFAHPVERVVEAAQWVLTPPVSVRSQMSLRIPGEQIKAQISNVAVHSVEDFEAGGVLVTAQGLKGRVTTSWREGRIRPTEPKNNFVEVESDVAAVVERPGGMTLRASLQVRSSDEPIQQFTIRLPDVFTAQLENAPDVELSIGRNEPETQTNLYDVRLNNATSDARIQLSLRTTQRVSPEQFVNVGYLEVIGAIRQYGKIRIMADPRWSVIIQPGQNVSRIADEANSSELPVVGTYEFFRQPSRLEVRAEQQETRLIVEPSHRLVAKSQRFELESTFSCRVSGAPISSIQIDTKDWIVDNVGPFGAVRSRNQSEPGAPLQLQLEQSVADVFDIVITSHLPVASRSVQAELQFPMAQANVVSPGYLLVSSANNVTLDIQPETTIGFQSSVIPPDLRPTGDVPGVARITRFFRTVGEQGSQQLAFRYQLHERQITTHIRSEIELASSVAQVKQYFEFLPKYEPISRVELTLPEELVEALANSATTGNLTISVLGETFDFDPYDLLNAGTDAAFRILPIELPEAMLERVSLVVEFPWGTSLSGREANSTVAIPLLTTELGDLRSNIIEVDPQLGIRVNDFGESTEWRRDDDMVRSGSLQAVGGISSQPASSIRLSITKTNETAVDAHSNVITQIHRAWFQSWMNKDIRLDRAVFTVETNQTTLEFILPDQVDVTQVVAVVDGQSVATNFANEKLRVPLLGDNRGPPTIELSLPYKQRPTLGTFLLTPPQLVGTSSARTWFWQLVLPEDEHVWGVSDNVTASSRWVWSGSWWTRSAPRSQQGLEAWSNATSQPEATGGNQYLLSSFGPLEPVAIRAFGRRWLVGLCSLLAMALGLVFIYIPVVRHPFVILLMVVGILLLLGWNVSLALMLGQASLLGLLATLAGQLASVFTHLIRMQWSQQIVTVTGQNDSRTGKNSGWAQPGSSQISTATLPASGPNSGDSEA